MKQIRAQVERLCISIGKESQPCDMLNAELIGLTDDHHGGFTRKADGRDSGIKRGTLVRNWRQWSAVSLEELAVIAGVMKLPHLDPAWLSANITFSGCASLTQVPKGSMIWFPSGAVLTVEGENAPCLGPGKQIAKHFPQVTPAHFPRAAMRLRGLVGTVYRAGAINLGDDAVICFYEPFEALSAPPSLAKTVSPSAD